MDMRHKSEGTVGRECAAGWGMTYLRPTLACPVPFQAKAGDKR